MSFVCSAHSRVLKCYAHDNFLVMTDSWIKCFLLPLYYFFCVFQIYLWYFPLLFNSIYLFLFLILLLIFTISIFIFNWSTMLVIFFSFMWLKFSYSLLTIFFCAADFLSYGIKFTYFLISSFGKKRSSYCLIFLLFLWPDVYSYWLSYFFPFYLMNLLLYCQHLKGQSIISLNKEKTILIWQYKYQSLEDN